MEPPPATLRQRTTTTTPSSTTPSSTSDSPPLVALPPCETSPPLRPTLSRATTGEITSFDLSETDEPLFSGLSLLDLLVLVDAHLDLASRHIRKTGAQWSSKANKLVVDSKARAGKIKLPRVDSEKILSSVLESDQGKKVNHLTAKEREKLERRYRELRSKTMENMKKLSEKWEEEKTVALRDKLSFFFGVMNVLVSALLLGFAPTWIPFYYTVQVLAFLPLRIYSYKKRLFHYFLFDLCYAINGLCLVYLWILPGNPYLFEACYGLTMGSLGTAIATWRNSLVFHSVDKVISLAIHIFPPFVFTTIRHFYPNPEVRYPALKHLQHLRPWRSMAINMVVYLIWQGLYFRYVIVARSEKIKQGRATSFTFLINDKKRLIGKIAAKVPEAYRETAFMLGQAVYTFVTLLVPIFVLYDSKFWSSVYVLSLFAVSVWNGAGFYYKIMHLEQKKRAAASTPSSSAELDALRKELEEQQILLAKYIAASQSPTTSASSGGVDLSRTQSLDGIAELDREGEREGMDEVGKEMHDADVEVEGEEKERAPLDEKAEETMAREGFGAVPAPV